MSKRHALTRDEFEALVAEKVLGGITTQLHHEVSGTGQGKVRVLTFFVGRRTDGDYRSKLSIADHAAYCSLHMYGSSVTTHEPDTLELIAEALLMSAKRLRMMQTKFYKDKEKP